MKREFFINILFLLLANLLIKPFYLLWVEVEVNNIVGPAIYGTYAGIFSLCYILQIFADPGLLNYNTTHISSNRKSIHSEFGQMFGLKLSLGILYVIIVLIVAILSGYDDFQWTLIPWITLNVFLLSMILYLRSNILGLGKYRWDSLFSILDKALMILILVYMIYVSNDRMSFNIMDFIQGQTIAYSLSFIIVFTFIASQKINIKPKINSHYFRQTIKKSIPYAWLLFLMTIYTRIDSYMLERLIPDNGYEAGVYASAFRIFDAGNSFAYLFAVLLLPIFSNMLSEKLDIKPLLSASAHFLFTGISITCIFLAVFATEIMLFFYPDDATSQYESVFILLMIALIPMAMAYISGSLLTANKALKLLNKIALSGVVINVVLNGVLIPYFQSVGTAFATTITQLTMTIIQLWFVMRIWKIGLSPKIVIQYVFLLLVSGGIAYIFHRYIGGNSFIKIISGIIISLIIAFILGTIKIDFLKVLLKKRISA